jgi:amidohydrolase
MEIPTLNHGYDNGKDARMTDLTALRRHLHRHPERSGDETVTAAYIASLLKRTHPTALHTDIGGNGIVAVYGEGGQPAVLLRADLDALPITERNDVPHASENVGTAHLCGHDGHMAVMVGVAERIALRRAELTAPVAVLFQPAEETGQGAAAMLRDALFETLRPARVFAFHNIPGQERGSVLVRNGAFAMASVGADVELVGRTSHAAEPELGNSPVPALLRLSRDVASFPDAAAEHGARAVSTIIHLNAGSEAFGTTPGNARLLATLRSDSEQFMAEMKSGTEHAAAKAAAADGLEWSLEWKEDFPSVQNDPACSDLVRAAARDAGRPLIELAEPFRWSEDFAHFTHRFCGALFGIGSGSDHPALHDGWYDFPDDIIEPAVRVFLELVMHALAKGNRI